VSYRPHVSLSFIFGSIIAFFLLIGAPTVMITWDNKERDSIEEIEETAEREAKRDETARREAARKARVKRLPSTGVEVAPAKAEASPDSGVP